MPEDSVRIAIFTAVSCELSQHFFYFFTHVKAPIIKILRSYSRLDYSKRGFQFSDATIDQLNSNYLSSWGFIQKYGRWYYKNHYVEMGDLLPLPEELEPKQPLNGKKLKIEASLSWEMNDGKIRFQVSSNIPEETPLMFTLRGKEYTAQSKSVAGNSVSISGMV